MTKDVIQSLAFGETPILEKLLMSSYEYNPVEGDQLDMPMTPILFRAKCFTIPLAKQIPNDEYNEKLIEFYSQKALDMETVWNLKKIERFVLIQYLKNCFKIFNSKYFEAIIKNQPSLLRIYLS